MSASESKVDQRDEKESPGSKSQGSRGRLNRSWIAGGLVVGLALTLGLAYSLWWTKPNTFTDVGNGLSMKQTVADLHPVTFDMVQRSVHEDPETITLNGVRPRVLTNTADALVTFAICQRSGEPFMSADGVAARSCELVTDVDGERVRLTPAATTTITMTVTPRRPGQVVIRGMDVTYARGSDHLWQRGTQATGPVVKVNVKDQLGAYSQLAVRPRQRVGERTLLPLSGRSCDERTCVRPSTRSTAAARKVQRTYSEEST